MHRHEATRCPARDPKMAPMLLQHLSPANAGTHGVTFHGEAVVNDAHTLYVIVDSPDQESVSRFMQPFARVGTVEILRSSSCEAVVGREGCDASR